MRTCLTCAVLVLVSTGPAGAETFYDQDGVQLSATARTVEVGAAVCRIREERHSAEEYARLLPNHGQLLHLWRLEMIVANSSGKVLDYLNAHVNVESEWPPCDNWGMPDGYDEFIVWTGPLMSVQEVGSVQPGEKVRETALLLAFHADRPTFGRWDIDYDFAAGTAAASAAPGAERPSVAAADAPDARTPGQVAPEPTCAGKEVGAACWMETENQPGCYLWNPNLARQATVTWTGDCADGLANGAGERTWNYTNAGGEATSSTGTGGLRNGEGNGQWTIRRANGSVEEGSYVGGERNGQWTIRRANGSVEEGSYVGGEMNGQWTVRYPTKDLEGNTLGEIGGVLEGPLVDGKMNGQYTFRWANGSVWEGPYVDGEKNGRWTERRVDGGVEEGPYVDGKRNGHWVWRYSGGTVREEGSYVDGKRNGHWVWRYSGGTVREEGSYVDGKRNGHWVWRYSGGTVREEGSYVDGKKNGHWTARHPDGTVREEGSYVDEKKNGHWLERSSMDDELRLFVEREGSYVDGKKHGRWVGRYPTLDPERTDFYGRGGVLESFYVDGEPHGRWTWRYADGHISHREYVNGEQQ